MATQTVISAGMAARPKPSPSHAGQPVAAHGAVCRWLLALAGLTLVMVVVGGVTRLTESGLSITRWDPIAGVVPPLSAAQWRQEFAHYRAIDQYGAVHAGMTLAQFQTIYFWEFTHRLLGRFVGLVAALGWLWFAVRRQVPAGYGVRLLIAPLFVGIQGLFGWLMVASGLKPGMIEVAPGWLAAHLLTALAFLAFTLWTALDLARSRARLTAIGVLTAAALALQLLYGALMAGLRAGRVTDQWPLMNGAPFPGPSESGETLGRMLSADPAIVHFIHRWWAWVVVALLIVLARRVKASGARAPARAIHIAFGTQLLLGIATVMAGVPLWLAALHQLVGALLVAATVWGTHALGEGR